MVAGGKKQSLFPFTLFPRERCSTEKRIRKCWDAWTAIGWIIVGKHERQLGQGTDRIDSSRADIHSRGLLNHFFLFMGWGED
jgi:hypothetical protein